MLFAIELFVSILSFSFSQSFNVFFCLRSNPISNFFFLFYFVLCMLLITSQRGKKTQEKRLKKQIEIKSNNLYDHPNNIGA